MRKEFTNSTGVRCVFTDEGVTFCDKKQEMFFPNGAIETINVSLLGILQVTHRAQVCTFAIDRKDRSEVRAAVKEVRQNAKNAPEAGVLIMDAQSSDLSPEEQLKQLKEQFVRGAISKEEYDAKKRVLKK